MSEDESEWSPVRKSAPVVSCSPVGPDDLWTSSEEDERGKRGDNQSDRKREKGGVRGGRGRGGNIGGRGRGKNKVKLVKKPLPSVKNMFDELVTKSSKTPVRFVPPGFNNKKSAGINDQSESS